MRTITLLFIGFFLAACGGTGTLSPNPETGEIQYLTRENEQLQRRINELQEEQTAYRESLAEAEKQAAQTLTPDEAQQRVADLSAENEQLQRRISELEGEQAAYRESLVEAEKLAAKSADDTQWQQRIRALEIERDDYRARLAEAEQATPAEDPGAQQRLRELEAERDGYRQSLGEAEQQVAALETQLREARQATPAAQPAVSSGAQGTVVATIPTDPHFIANSARLNQAGIVYMRDVAAQLKTTYPGRRFRVVGYTDNAPLSERAKQTFPSNWELSAARAGMLVRHLQWTHKMDPSRFEVVGRGHYLPLESNDTPEGRRANRTVQIEVLN